jgi:hypothetical protein
MATHLYFNPGGHSTRTTTSIDGTVGIPATTAIELRDGTDHVQLTFTDLDTLDEMVRLFEQARAEHVAALCDGHSEMVLPDELRSEDLFVLDGDLVCVDTTIIDGEFLIVRYGKKYMDGYDMTGDRSIRIVRSRRVKRLSAGAVLSVVAS